MKQPDRAPPQAALVTDDQLPQPTSAKVMLVDDEEVTLDVLQAFLEEAGYSRFVACTDASDAIALMRREHPDILLLDLMMPGVDGFEVLAAMRADETLRHMPVLILTASSDPADKLRALDLGATDFLAKPVDPSELTLRMRNTLAAKAHRDILANFDALTGLPNRKRFLERVHWALQLARRTGVVGGVLHIGLDRFKQVNEALGPSVGDSLLRAVAARLQDCVRESDYVARAEGEDTRAVLSRLGGDEFTVLLPALADERKAARVASRLLEAMAAPFHILAHELFVTCCIGIAVFPHDGDADDAIVSVAGVAMRHAKQQGRQVYRYYSRSLDAEALHRLSLEGELRKVFERGELELHYQPKIDIQSNRLVGAEALVRWRHPERGLISPGEFIPLAEETGLIVPLGEWVLFEACRQIGRWHADGLAIPRIAVNVSSHQLQQERLAKCIRAALGDIGIAACYLGLELTETAIMANAHEHVIMLNDLKALGIKLAIDDFGTGYSSLSYLKRFPLDELKIDRSFVTDLVTDRDSAAIVTAIIAMAHSLGLRVVAEGVETEAQLAFLARHGCDECQGYLFDRPLPAAAFGRRLLSASLPEWSYAAAS